MLSLGGGGGGGVGGAAAVNPRKFLSQFYMVFPTENRKWIKVYMLQKS